MNFKRLSTGAALALGIASLDLPVAHANVILTYTGNDFNQFEGTQQTTYTTSDKVTAMITLANPLALNTPFQVVTPIAFALNDGVQTITDASVSYSSSFEFSTNATGKIIFWDVSANSNDTTSEIRTFETPTQVGLDTGECTGAPQSSCVGNGVGRIEDSPGVWTSTSQAVPAPPLSNLAGLGVLGLAYIWHRRRRIGDLVRYSTQP